MMHHLNSTKYRRVTNILLMISICVFVLLTISSSGHTFALALARRAAAVDEQQQQQHTDAPEEKNNNKTVSSPSSKFVVTAYYPMKSKHSHDQYNTWMSNLFTMQDDMVIFTSAKMAPFLQHARSKSNLRLTKQTPTTIIVQLELNETHTSKMYDAEFWKHQFQLDPEKTIHKSYELYWVWLSKGEFLKRAVDELGPSADNNSFFAWVDIGYFRTKTWNHRTLLSRIPQSLRNDQIMMLELNPDNKILAPDKGAAVGGGFIGGYTAAILRWNKLFYPLLQSKQSEFIGKDQLRMYQTCFVDDDLCFLVKQDRNNRNFGDPWFFMAPYLILGENETNAHTYTPSLDLVGQLYPWLKNTTTTAAMTTTATTTMTTTTTTRGASSERVVNQEKHDVVSTKPNTFDMEACLIDVLGHLPVGKGLEKTDKIGVFAHHWDAQSGYWNENIRFYPMAQLKTAVSSSCIVWEVGAHESAADTQRLLQSYPHCMYHAYEPIPEFYDKLQQKWANHKQVVTHNYGLADKDSVFTVSQDAVQGQSTYIGGDAAAGTAQQATSMNVTIKSFEFAMSEAGGRAPDLLHVNCEGCEWAMIPQAKATGFLDQISVINLGTHNYPHEKIGERSLQLCKMRAMLSETHIMIKGMPFGWERWVRWKKDV